MKKLYHTHISAKHNYFDLKLDELLKYRNLIWLFTSRAFKIKYKQTILGPLWLFISPLFTSIVQMVLFGNIAKLSTDGIPQILFYLSGNAIWGYFSSCLTSNAGTFTGNAALFGKVYFSRLVVPVTNVFSNICGFGIKMILVVLVLAYFIVVGQVEPNWLALLAMPLILINLGVLGMGFGIIVSSFTTKYRDLSVLVGFGMSLWSYATPVVYPLSAVKDEWLLNILLANPVTAWVEFFRYTLLGRGAFLPVNLLFSFLVTFIVAIVGIIIFNKIERNFMDTV